MVTYNCGIEVKSIRTAYDRLFGRDDYCFIAIEQSPFYTLPFSSAASNGGVARVAFPLTRATVDALPDGVDAMFVCSDLQGVIDSRIDGRAEPEQLGVFLAEKLYEFAYLGEFVSGTYPDFENHNCCTL